MSDPLATLDPSLRSADVWSSPVFVVTKAACLITIIWKPSPLLLLISVSVALTISLCWYMRTVRRLQRSEDDAIHSLRISNEVLDNIPGLTLVSDAIGNLVYVNHRILDYTGLTREQLCGDGWLQTVHPQDVSILQSHWIDAIVARKSVSVEYRWRRSDGEYRRFQIAGAPISASGFPQGLWYGLMRDVEEERTAEEFNTKARSAMNESARSAAVTEMAATIAHEINQPLMAVMTNAAAGKAWLTGKSPSVREAIEALDRIERDASSAAKVVSGIRALFKRTPLEREPLELGQVIQASLGGVDAEIRRISVKVKNYVSPTLPLVLGDADQLRQVFHNLLQNAIEAMEQVPEENRYLEVRAGFHPDRKVLQIDVHDSGVGTQEIERIFEAFVSTKSSGLGIGLAISKTIVESHQGTLSAEHRYPCGMTFTIELPTSL